MHGIARSCLFIVVCLGTLGACQLALDFGAAPQADSGSFEASADAPGAETANGDAGTSIVATLGDAQARALAVDVKNLYWLVPGGNDLYVMDKQQVLGVPTAYPTNETIFASSDLTVVGSRAFFAAKPDCPHVYGLEIPNKLTAYENAGGNCDEVRHFDVSGTSLYEIRESQAIAAHDVNSASGVQVLTMATEIGRVAVGPDYVYVAGALSITAYARASGIPAVIAPSDNACGVGFVGDSVYWVTADGHARRATAVPSARPIMELGSEDGTATHMAVNANYVVWTDTHDRVIAAPSTGSGATRVISENQRAPTSLAVDDASAYWATSDGFIRTVPLR